jgi:hypothetical protein
MNKIPESIDKIPELKPAEDYYRLRREGIGFIANMASSLWTDYNTHDPGITILEALCYAITDLAYRANWDIKDLLTLEISPTDKPLDNPFPNQAFFTARKILTVNPVTLDDFRRLLIDLDGVRNAWLFCNPCNCDFGYYGEVKNGKFQLTYKTPTQSNSTESKQPEKVKLNGLYEVLLELESDAELGDLNDHKIEESYTYFDAEHKPHAVILEIRFPELELSDSDRKIFFECDDIFLLNEENNSSFEKFNLTAKISTDKTTYKPLTDSEFRNHWRNIFWVRFTITLTQDNKEIIIKDATLRIFSDIATKNADSTLADIKARLKNKTPTGFIQRYRNKLLKINKAIDEAKSTLHKHRNLDEDFCRINVVNIEDIAVCADIEVAPEADIEFIQAKIWFEIENYFNPAIHFYSLQELLDSDIPVETIFNGPQLSCGFIKDEELQAAQLKTILRTSDIINLLADIEGVVAVNNLLFSKYDIQGRAVKDTASTFWILYIKDRHQPRLSRNLSRFLFLKNGLPFLPRMDEAYQTLIQLRGENERPRIKNDQIDLKISSGTFLNPENYYPLQYSFPLTYGIGTEGLSSGASPERKAQAKQLKAYLMVFEQLLANYLAQLAHTQDLFSLDYSIDRTYFSRKLTKEIIESYDELVKTELNYGAENNTQLDSMTETVSEFHERRNRFLNHLMARFGEQFDEYELLLKNFLGQEVALERLIEDKISFLKAYPVISHDRNKAFNYKDNPTMPDNFSGLEKRVSLLLGYPNLSIFWTLNGNKITNYQLVDENQVSFVINDLSLSNLKSDGFSETVLQQLNIIKNQEFIGQTQFLVEINKIIDKLEKIKYLLFLQHSKKIRKEIIWKEGEISIDFNPTKEVSINTALKNAYDEITEQIIQANDYEVIEEGSQFYLIDKDKYPKAFKTKAEVNAFYDELIGWATNERAIVVEHLLLRPKFLGDALYPVYSDNSCNLCAEKDPYSFRLTFVMPGWTAPYNTNMEMRRFAERTIRQETPAHLIVKICWVDNIGLLKRGISILETLVDILGKNDTILNKNINEYSQMIFEKYCDIFESQIQPIINNNEWDKVTWQSKITEFPKEIQENIKLSDKICQIIHSKFLDYFNEIILCPYPIIATIIKLIEKEHYINTRIKSYDCAWEIFEIYSNRFTQWFESNKNNYWLESKWQSEITNLFKEMKNVNFVCIQSLSANIHNELLDYFTNIAIHGWQFERFEAAWNQWLEENAKIDWTEVHLHEQILAIFKQSKPDEKDLSTYTKKIIEVYADEFYYWMQKEILNGITLEKFDISKLLSNENIKGLPKDVTDLLIGKTIDGVFVSGLYAKWIEVSYRLQIVVDLLSQLRNTYPTATLHDFDEGNDENPVRLGSTALGVYPLRSSAT